jgi:hypothetical protein
MADTDEFTIVLADDHAVARSATPRVAAEVVR